MERRKRCGDAIPGDLLDRIADLQERIKSAAVASTANALMAKNAMSRRPVFRAVQSRPHLDETHRRENRSARSVQAASFERDVRVAPKDIPNPGLVGEIALFVEVDFAEHSIELMVPQRSDYLAELQRAGLFDRLGPDLHGAVTEQGVASRFEVLGAETFDDRYGFWVLARVSSKRKKSAFGGRARKIPAPDNSAITSE